MNKNLKIVFMGTPEFAVPSLDILIKNHYEVATIITSPDKPGGRGLQLQQSPVKKFALEHGIPVLQPIKLKDPEFLVQLKTLEANLFIVVAFRMLPEVVWQMPLYGTFNLHGSLLPAYRGAAPINWAVINGEHITGLTTFFLQKEIDTGAIIMQDKINIEPDMTAGELHDKMMIAGAELVLETVKAIELNEFELKKQQKPPIGKDAPKIFKEDCKIDWSKATLDIYNFIRGLSPYPGAWSTLENKILKIFRAEVELYNHHYPVGKIMTDGKYFLKITTSDGFILVKELQIEGRKKMGIEEFLRGFSMKENLSIQ